MSAKLQCTNQVHMRMSISRDKTTTTTTYNNNNNNYDYCIRGNRMQIKIK